MTRPIVISALAWRPRLAAMLLASGLAATAHATEAPSSSVSTAEIIEAAVEHAGPNQTQVSSATAVVTPLASTSDPVATLPVAKDDSIGGAATSLIEQGLEYLGVPYRFGGTSPEKGFDCSGFVGSVFRNALGFELPRSARDMAKEGEKVSVTDLKPGDLVFFNTMRRAFSHVGIYMGDNRFVHAPSRGGGVRVEDMRDSYWSKRFNGARRVLEDEAARLPGMR